MKFPNWLKIVWWLGITGLLTYFLLARLADLLSGKAAAADIAVFGVWMALLLAPLFSEVSLLGVTLKNEIEELKGAVAAQLTELRTDIRSAVDVRATFSPQFHMAAPVPDAQLPKLEEWLKAAVVDALAEHNKPAAGNLSAPSVPEDVSLMFATRYQIEVEVRRLAKAAFPRLGTRPVIALIPELERAGILDSRLEHGLIQVYRITSPAVHGEPISEAQLTFVRDVGPGLIAALRAVNVVGDEQIEKFFDRSRPDYSSGNSMAG